MKYLKLPQADIILQAATPEEYEAYVHRITQYRLLQSVFTISSHQTFFLIEGRWIEVRGPRLENNYKEGAKLA